MRPLKVTELPESCFEGIVPAMLATCGADGMPNLTWLSQVSRIDDRHVALSCQFFRKTRENLEHDARAQLQVFDPGSARHFRLDLRFARRETSGPSFDAMAKRIEAIAALTGTEAVFALKSIDVFEVMMLSQVEVRTPKAAPPIVAARDPLQALARITDAIAACRGLEQLLQSGMDCLTQHLGLDTACLYLCEPSERSLYALASRGYAQSAIGASVAYGLGLVGVAAAQRMPVRVADMARELRYGSVVREQIERAAGQGERELPLPKLEGVTSVLAVPLVVDGELFGVLSSESTRRQAYGERDELLLQTAGQILAQAVARALEREKEDEPERDAPPSESGPPSVPGTLKVKYYGVDDSVFLDGEYLIKGLPGRILWTLLTLHAQERRTTFLNRELRLNPSLELPRYRDNLEARLLLLQRRLLEKGGPLRISREERGRLSLHCDQRIELERA